MIDTAYWPPRDVAKVEVGKIDVGPRIWSVAVVAAGIGALAASVVTFLLGRLLG